MLRMTFLNLFLLLTLLFSHTLSNSCDDCMNSFVVCDDNTSNHTIFCNCLKNLSECYAVNNCPSNLDFEIYWLCVITKCSWCNENLKM